MGKSLHIRLHAYAPDGTSLGMLPRPLGVDADFQHNDAGTLKVTYSRLALGGSILQRGLEQGLAIGFEVSDGGEWIEPYNARFVLTSRSRDAKDRSDTVTLNLMTYAWLLKKALLIDTSKLLADGDNKGKRPFYSANPGTIVKTMLDENRERGGVAQYVTAGFDTGKDSSGAAWSNVMTLYYDPGVDTFTALSNLAANGVCDWRTQGMTLNLWNADSAALCHDLSESIVIPLATQALESPEEETIEELASHILVMGDGIDFTQDNNAAPTPWGKWELYSSQGGVSDEGTARLLMQSQLDQAARVRGQYTRSVLVTDVDALPLIDYAPGDWITAPTVSHGEKVRIQRVTISLSSQGLKAALILNDRLYDAQTRQAKRIQGITGGAVAGGAQGGRPAPAQDHRVPKAVQGVVASSNAYVDEIGQAFGLAMVGWAEVTQATDNTAIDIASYEVQYQRSTDQTGYWNAAGTTTSLNISFGHLDCGATIRIRVRAIPQYSDKPGEWSGIVELVIASDTTPPSVPSKPVLSSSLGVVEVRSDGFNENGGRFEPDTAYLEAGRSESNGNWVAVGKLQPGSIMDDIGLTLNKTYWYALRAVDYSGNKSEWSAGASVAVAPAVTQDELNDLAERVTDSEEVSKDQAQQIAETQKQLTSQAEQIADNKQAAADAQAQAQKVATDLAAANKELAQAQKDITANRQSIQQTSQTVNQVKSDVDATKQTVAGVQDAQQQMQSDLSQAQKDITANKTALEQANKELDTVGKTASDAASKAQQAIRDAASAQTTADGKNRIYHDWQDPTVSDPSLRPVVGDLWYRYQRYWTTSLGEPDNSPSALANFYTYSQGEPDNSPSVLVTLDSEIVEVLIWDGSRWNTYTLVASNVIVSGTITGDLIAANTIVAGHLAAGSVTSDKIVSLAVTADKLAANSVSAEKLTANSVTTAKLVSNAVTADKIAANAVTAGKIAAGSVTTDKLAALAVTAAKIAALTITGDKIAANAISADKIAANAVTSDKIAANAVTAGKIAANAITAGKIAAGAIDGMTITGAIIQTSGTANRGVKVTSGGLTAYNSSGGTVTTINASSGQITTSGPVISGGSVSGTTVTGGVIQTSSTASRGVKITSSGLAAYDGSGNAKTVISSDTGQITTDGAVISNGGISSTTITGGVITGAVVRSSVFDYPRFEMNGTSLSFYDASRTRTIYLSGDSGSTYLRGKLETQRQDGQSIIISADTRFVDAETGQFVGNHPAIVFSDSNNASNWCPNIYADMGSSSDLTADLVLQAGAWNAHNNSNARLRLESGGGWSMSSRTSPQDTAWSGVQGNGEGTSADVYCRAGDANGTVGLYADISSGNVALGGYLSGFVGRETLWSRNWVCGSSGCSAGGNLTGAWTAIGTPAKYGHYHAVACADVNFGSIITHPSSTGNSSRVDVVTFNAGTADCTTQIWCGLIAWLEE